MPVPIELAKPPSLEMQRARELFHEHQRQIFVRTDRLFAWLMGLQYVAAIAAASWISPRSWAGTSSQIHPHVWGAVFLGGLVSALPVFLAIRQPGLAATRYTIAIGQMLMSGLLIHLTGGRIETHFHIFGSLAFLAFYRDWRVFVPATLIVTFDHLLRGLLWPESVFGVGYGATWRWLEHSGWVLFEDAFLVIAGRQSIAEMWDIALQRAELENTQRIIEAEVIDRTEALAKMHKQHIELARRVGMAEVATSVLHNVGNVLNSVNVSASVISEKLKNSGLRDLQRATALLEQHMDDPGAFVNRDVRGRHLPRFLIELSRKLSIDEGHILAEMVDLTRSIDHIKDIVTVQQSYACVSGFVEEVSLVELLEDALRIDAASYGRHKITIVREFDVIPPVLIAKQKFLQVLVNLLGNAKHAMMESESGERTLTIRLTRSRDNWIHVEVTDTGAGIAPENLTRIFAHGFTTRKEGHGFGLHSAANLATEMGGTLTGHSNGMGLGASFVLRIPFQSTGVMAYV